MNYLIIGGNATGMSAATRLRKNKPDASITVIEKGDILSFGACGLPYFIGDEFSDPNEMIVRSVESFQKLNITIHLNHEAIDIDSTEKKVTTTNLQTGEKIIFSYDKVLIASGASPINPNIKGISLEGVHTLTTIKDGLAIKEASKHAQNIVIIGAGFIGLETAEAMLHLGKKVTIIQLSPRVSDRVFDSEMTDLFEKEIYNSGIDLRLDEAVEELIGDKKVTLVKTNKGEYPADLVIMSIGFIPNTKWINNVDKLPNGAIIIDNQGQTSLKHIYAGGDCATIPNAVSKKPSYIPLATTANKLGRLLGNILADIPSSFQGTLGTSALRFKDFEIARTGLSEHEVQELGINYFTNFIQDFNHTSYTPGKKPLYIKIIYNKDTRVLLGAQICGGQGAVLRIDALSVAIFSQMTVDTLGMMDFVYAPPFSRTWDIMNIAGNTAK